MPKASELKCYFRCVIDGPLHRFPKPEWPYIEKFNEWKSVLDLNTQMRGDNYIYNCIRLCYRHFDKKYCLPSKRLTKNAIPTLPYTTSMKNIDIDDEQNITASLVIETQQPSTSGLCQQSEIVTPDYIYFEVAVSRAQSAK